MVLRTSGLLLENAAVPGCVDSYRNVGQIERSACSADFKVGSKASPSPGKVAPTCDT